jgi:hypothetical protein
MRIDLIFRCAMIAASRPLTFMAGYFCGVSEKLENRKEHTPANKGIGLYDSF